MEGVGFTRGVANGVSSRVEELAGWLTVLAAAECGYEQANEPCRDSFDVLDADCTSSDQVRASLARDLI